jgi:phage gp29-like protein
MSELVDQFGRPIKVKELVQEIASPVSGVRDIWYDSQATSLTPSRLATTLAELREGEIQNFITLADEMEERNPHYFSVLGTRKNALTGREPVVESAGDDAAAVEQADAVRELLRRPEFDDLLDDLMDALGKGFSVNEILWNTDDPAIWWPRRYKPVDQRWFLFDKKTLELRLRDRDVREGLALVPYKWIIHYPRLKTGFPVSGGLGRIAAVSHMCLNYTLKDWMRFVEVYGQPYRLGKYGVSATAADKAILKRAVINIGADAAAIIPDSMNIDFKESSGGAGGHLLFKATAEWMNDQTSRAILGQTASTGGTPGKLGNDQEQADVRRDILRKDAKKLAATLNAYLVRPFIDLNFGPQKKYPTIKWQFKEPADLPALGEFLAKTVPMGLRVEQSVIRDMAGLPDPEEGAEVLMSPGGASSGPAAPASAQNARISDRRLKIAKTALNAAGDPEDIVDDLEQFALDGWEPAMRPLADALQQLADECETAEEFKSRLPEIVALADLSELTLGLATAMFKARGAGDGDEV